MLDLQYFNQRLIIRLPTSKRVTLNGLFIPLVYTIVTVIFYEQVRVQISRLNLTYFLKNTIEKIITSKFRIIWADVGQPVGLVLSKYAQYYFIEP